MQNALIIGAGPAGISAAIYLLRAEIPTTIIYNGMGALGMAHLIENYYGFEEPIPGPELFERGLAQARRLGATIVEDEVVGLVWGDEKMTALTKTAEYPADVIIMATGASRIAPKIPGLRELEGVGVSYCAICDAFFYRQKRVAVLGNGEYALHEANVLLPTSAEVTLYTQGKPLTCTDVPENLRVETRKITRLVGDQKLTGVELEDGSVIDTDGFFVAVGIAGSADFAKKIGAEVEGVNLVVDDNCQTTLPGLYAVGDCTGGLLQVAKAVADGAKAGTHAVKFLRNAQ